ncbi:hypothetical protein LSCM1_00448 [Leishmania martiniquensis]|uniref:Uncharacterized protein n=1 Tax=Leishmania martiniquensis TaxID=1580590 RepID=A0A836GBX8_9TRYP|nr:hypothetical protein LSCM1_00448 [Leishmania martiniquensis]
MSNNRRSRPAKRINGAAKAERRRVASSPTAAPDRHIPPIPQAKSVLSAPKSIEDIASLFIGASSGGSGGNVYESNERIRSKRKNATGPTKRPREDAGNLTTGKHSPAKRHKRSVICSLSPKVTSPTIESGRKAGSQPGAANRHENDEDDEEDIKLSKAVQAQTLGFLQQLNPTSRKVFWGLRAAAQGKQSAAAAATAAKGKAKEAKKVADRVEEIWRVGGAYMTRGADGDIDGSDRGRGAISDCESQVSTSSSEPSWVTDSSEGEEDFRSEDEAGNDMESAPVATGAARRCSTVGPPKRGGGGGRLFQGDGDGVWDED